MKRLTSRQKAAVNRRVKQKILESQGRATEGDLMDAQRAFSEVSGNLADALNSHSRAMGALARVAMQARKQGKDAEVRALLKGAMSIKDDILRANKGLHQVQRGIGKLGAQKFFNSL